MNAGMVLPIIGRGVVMDRMERVFSNFAVRNNFDAEYVGDIGGNKSPPDFVMDGNVAVEVTSIHMNQDVNSIHVEREDGIKEAMDGRPALNFHGFRHALTHKFNEITSNYGIITGHVCIKHSDSTRKLPSRLKDNPILHTLDSPPKGWYVCFSLGMKEVTAMRFKVASRVRGWAMRRSARRSEPGSSAGTRRPGCVGATASSVRAAAIAGIAVRHAGRRISATVAGSGSRSPRARSSIRPGCR